MSMNDNPSRPAATNPDEYTLTIEEAASLYDHTGQPAAYSHDRVRSEILPPAYTMIAALTHAREVLANSSEL